MFRKDRKDRKSIVDGIADIDLQILLNLNCLSLAAISCVNIYYNQLAEHASLSKIRFFDTNNKFVHNKQINPLQHQRNRIGASMAYQSKTSSLIVFSDTRRLISKLAIIGGNQSEQTNLTNFIENLNKQANLTQRTQPYGCRIYWDTKIFQLNKKKFSSTRVENLAFNACRLNPYDAGIILIDISSASYNEEKLTRLIEARAKTLLPNLYSDAPIFLVGVKSDLVYESARIYLLKNIAKKYDFINGCLVISTRDNINCNGLFYELENLLLEKIKFVSRHPPKKVDSNGKENIIGKKSNCRIM